MRFDDFGHCELESLKLAIKLSHLGHIAIVTYGAYHPITDPSTWDERWQRIYHQEYHSYDWRKGFVHFWVECNNLILDNAARQFGESDHLMINIPDQRYEKFGILDSSWKKNPLPNKPEILWSFRAIPA